MTAEPLVWIGKKEDCNEDGTVSTVIRSSILRPMETAGISSYEDKGLPLRDGEYI